jgi:hypothetical protein
MKKLSAKTGTYINKEGEQKNEYTKIGALMPGNDGGEYMLLDPTVNLAGVLLKQNALAAKENKPMRDSVMVSVFDEQNQGYQQQQPQAPQQGYQQPAPQGPAGQQPHYQQPPQGYDNRR